MSNNPSNILLRLRHPDSRKILDKICERDKCSLSVAIERLILASKEAPKKGKKR